MTTYLQKHAIGQCDVLDSGFGSLHNDDSLSPITTAEAFFKDFDFHDAQIEILTEPRHGILESAPVDAPNQPFPAAHAENTTYIANEGYVGHDMFSVRVWDKKYDVTIYYDVQSFDGLPSLDIANDNPWCDGHPSFGSFRISVSGMESSPLLNANPMNVNLQFSRRNRDRNWKQGSVSTFLVSRPRRFPCFSTRRYSIDYPKRSGSIQPAHAVASRRVKSYSITQARR